MVDVANVMGARADGWWRDRAGAAARLGREVMALASRGIPAAQLPRPLDGQAPAGRSFPAYVLVLEGQARSAAALLANEMVDYVTLNVRVVSAAGSGDDTIVDVVAGIVEHPGNAPVGASCLVVTADRELRRRCEALGATAAGPGWLLGLL